MSRLDTYLSWIEEGARKLESFQSKEEKYKGCFFYPYWKKQENYVNSRWQEASLVFSWLYQRTGNIHYQIRAKQGVDYWCRLQKSKGSFPEYSRYDNSFAATAFTTVAMAETAKHIPFNKEQMRALRKAANWLMDNDEVVYTNQQAAAAVALIKVYKLSKQEKYRLAAQKKLADVFAQQNREGYYLEKGGNDLGYSSLTLEMLGLYYQETGDPRILVSVMKFISLIAKGTENENIRGTNWMLIGGFEIFADKTKDGKKALKKVLEGENIKHLEYDNNYCTDLYRLCWAHDNASLNLKHKKIKEIVVERKYPKRSRALNVLRPIGLHRIRKVLR